MTTIDNMINLAQRELTELYKELRAGNIDEIFVLRQKHIIKGMKQARECLK